MNLSLIRFSLLLLLFTSCSQKPDVFLDINIPKDLKLLGHKGSGSINENGNILLQENTWKAISNAMQSIDGSEIDLQLSADSTLWISHDHEIKNCRDTLINFFLCSDEEIIKLSKCNFENSLIKLSTFIEKANTQSWKNKTLCLDLKFLYNPEMDQSPEGLENLLIFSAKEIKNAFKNSPFRIIIEVFTEEQYNYFENLQQFGIFLVNYSPKKKFIKTMNKEKRNLSLPIYNLPTGLNPSLFRIQNIWTINNANDFFKGLAYNPDIMQSDNIPMMQFFNKIKNGKKAIQTSNKTKEIKTKDDEFHPLLKISIPLEKNKLIEFKTIKGDFSKEVLLVFKAVDEEGNPVYWQSVDLSENPHSYFFINSEFLASKNGVKVHINIWNKSRSAIDSEFTLSQFELK